MAIFTLDQLTKPATRAEVQASIYQVLGILGVNTTSWGDGAVVRTMIVGASAMLSALSYLQARIARLGFLELSEGDWLALVAKYVYGVEVLSATYASGQIELHNSSGNLYDMDPGDFTVASTANGKNYRNVNAFSLGAGQTIATAFVAIEGGSASNAAPGTITTPVTNLLGVSVTNLDTFVGIDKEKDPALIARSKEKLGALSPNGPWDAYAYAARNAKRSTGEACGVTRTRVLKDGFGNVTLVVAGSSGAITGTLGNLATDLGAVDDAVNRNAEPLAVAATAVSASPVAVTVAYEAWLYDRPGLSDTEAKATVQAALADFFAGLPIGGAVITPGGSGYVYQDALRAVVSSAVPAIFHAVITTPGADTALTSTQVATLIHSTLAHAVIHRVTAPEGT